MKDFEKVFTHTFFVIKKYNSNKIVDASSVTV